jgi:hypothetical protein
MAFSPVKTSYVSPAGEAVWFSLDKPDTRYNEDGVFGGQVKMSAKAAEPIIAKLEELNDQSFAGPKRNRAKTPIIENDDGTVSIRVKTKKQPDAYDSKGTKLSKAVKLGNGSKIKVSGTFMTYSNGPNFGVTAYLNAVQIIKLVEYSKNPFSAVDEDGFVAGSEPSSPFASNDDDGEGYSADTSASDDDGDDSDF